MRLGGCLDVCPAYLYLGSIQDARTVPCILRALAQYVAKGAWKRRMTVTCPHRPAQPSDAPRHTGTGRVHGRLSRDARSHDEPRLAFAIPTPCVRSDSAAKRCL